MGRPPLSDSGRRRDARSQKLSRAHGFLSRPLGRRQRAARAGITDDEEPGRELPLAHGAQIPAAILAWCRDPIWIGGLGFECAGYALSVVALAGAPVSLVAVMMQGGIALFVLFAILFLGERAGAAEWAAIGGVILAMVMVALSLGNGEAGQRAATAAIAAVWPCCSPRPRRRARRRGCDAAAPQPRSSRASPSDSAASTPRR